MTDYFAHPVELLPGKYAWEGSIISNKAAEWKVSYCQFSNLEKLANNCGSFVQYRSDLESVMSGHWSH